MSGKVSVWTGPESGLKDTAPLARDEAEAGVFSEVEDSGSLDEDVDDLGKGVVGGGLPGGGVVKVVCRRIRRGIAFHLPQKSFVSFPCWRR